MQIRHLRKDDVGCLERHTKALKESELELLQKHSIEYVLYITMLYLSMLPGRSIQGRTLTFYKIKRSHHDPIWPRIFSTQILPCARAVSISSVKRLNQLDQLPCRIAESKENCEVDPGSSIYDNLAAIPFFFVFGKPYQMWGFFIQRMRPDRLRSVPRADTVNKLAECCECFSNVPRGYSTEFGSNGAQYCRHEAVRVCFANFYFDGKIMPRLF